MTQTEATGQKVMQMSHFIMSLIGFLMAIGGPCVAMYVNVVQTNRDTSLKLEMILRQQERDREKNEKQDSDINQIIQTLARFEERVKLLLPERDRR